VEDNISLGKSRARYSVNIGYKSKWRPVAPLMQVGIEEEANNYSSGMVCLISLARAPAMRVQL